MNVNVTLTRATHDAWTHKAEYAGITPPQLARDAMAVFRPPPGPAIPMPHKRTAGSYTVVITASADAVAAWDRMLAASCYTSRSALIRAAVEAYTPAEGKVRKPPRAAALTGAELADLIQLVERSPQASPGLIAAAFGGPHNARTLIRRIVLIRRRLQETPG